MWLLVSTAIIVVGKYHTVLFFCNLCSFSVAFIRVVCYLSMCVFSYFCLFHFCMCLLFVLQEVLASSHVGDGIFIQVTCGCGSNNLLESTTRGEADCSRCSVNSVHCGCQEMDGIRCLPGLSHVMYGWTRLGCGRSFLEVLYADSPSRSLQDVQFERFLMTSRGSCTTVEKLETVAKGCVPLKRPNKWPSHSSLTLVCDSTPTHTVDRVKAKRNMRKTGRNAGTKLDHVGPNCKKSA